MNLVLDTNIVISGLITPNGIISRLIIRDLVNSKLICPGFLLDELLGKFDKIKRITRLTEEQIKELVFRFIKEIDFIDINLIEMNYQKQAFELVKDIDKKDLLFVALSMQTGYKLWTGDKKLAQGLLDKGYKQIIDTQQIVEQFKSI